MGPRSRQEMVVVELVGSITVLDDVTVPHTSTYPTLPAGATRIPVHWSMPLRLRAKRILSRPTGKNSSRVTDLLGFSRTYTSNPIHRGSKRGNHRRKNREAERETRRTSRGNKGVVRPAAVQMVAL